MRVREKNYTDYGMTKEEVAKVFEECKAAENREKLEACARRSCPGNNLAAAVIQSIQTKSSYEKLSKREYIPIGKKDFYAYRRKTIAAYAAEK